ncbi:MAG: class I SAM-dependent methyltransferase [Spirochaetales bacterium]|nr:class I SAM-dependent methyltransferase [Leptospiraceae bacterium]MCP5482857.1 class I SAM-dependent methyltransferase [Spirochaetales bacterium]
MAKDYELLDAGNGQRLERLDELALIRPAPQVSAPATRPELWESWQVRYEPSDRRWHWRSPEKRQELRELRVQHAGLDFLAGLSPEGQIGFFPEQEPIWQELRRQKLASTGGARLLNLFGHTGLASLAALQAGFEVTQVDSSRGAMRRARANVALSGQTDGVRWIEEDVRRFLNRELRRKSVYDSVVLDPPSFGRGTKGEVWKLERDLPVLLEVLGKLLRPGGQLLLSWHTTGMGPDRMGAMLTGVFPALEFRYVPLCVRARSGAELAAGHLLIGV